MDSLDFEKQKEITIEGDEEQKEPLQIIPFTSNGKIDKSDPRTNQHFVKFVRHSGVTVKLWECSICGREFQHQYMLRRHLPGHTDERNYHCLVCGKSFRQLSTLSQHRTIHSLARPHTCVICDKTFNRISTLISHRKTHLDEKPFKCHICSKGFHQKGNLRNHLFSHTNERPYRCNLCDKGFNQQSNLTCHLKKVHPDSEKVVAKTRSSKHFPQPAVVPPNLPVVSMNFNNSGIVVDPIRTPEMDEILQRNQVPFALLKHNGSRPVLVKIFAAKIPKGKHMLVPVTASDLMNGGKLIFGDSDHDDTGKVPFDATNPLLHLQVPLAAILESYISYDGQHTITVHPPTAFSPDKNDIFGSIKVEESLIPQDNMILPDLIDSNTSEYTLTEIGIPDEKNIFHKYHVPKLEQADRCGAFQPLSNIPMKDPVLNDAQHSGEGSGLVRPAMQFGSPQHLLDPHGPPSYATDYDCRNLELFEPLECIETGKIKNEMISGVTVDNSW